MKEDRSLYVIIYGTVVLLFILPPLILALLFRLKSNYSFRLLTKVANFTALVYVAIGIITLSLAMYITAHIEIPGENYPIVAINYLFIVFACYFMLCLAFINVINLVIKYMNRKNISNRD